MTVTADDIASLVLRKFSEWPAKHKPVVRDNGLHEWVPLSAIVAQGSHTPIPSPFMVLTRDHHLRQRLHVY
jgi:hypothetical protein